MSQSLTTQSNRTRRPYRTPVLLIREILIVSCVPPPAAGDGLAGVGRTAWPTGKGSFVSSPLSLPVRESRCVFSKRIRMILIKHWIRCVSVLMPCSQPQSGPCQRLHVARAPARLDVPHRTKPPARLGFPSLLEKDKSGPSHLHRKRPKDDTNKTKSSFAVLFLSGSLVNRTRILSKPLRRFLLWRGGSRRNQVQEGQ